MNLPAISTTFLTNFRSLFKEKVVILEKMPKIYIHCYYFAKKYAQDEKSQRSMEELKIEAIDLIRSKIDNQCQCEELTIEIVRSVAPNKDMIRVTFLLDRDILFT